MVGDRTDAMLKVMDEGMHKARHEGTSRRIEVITGRRHRRNWTSEEKARILAVSAELGAHISAVARRWGVNRGLLNFWRRDTGLSCLRSAQAGAQHAMFMPVTVVDDRTSYESSSSDVAQYAAGPIEIEIAGDCQ